VGTHALIHREVDMKRVAFVVIDEQHRFGVEQRTHLVRKAGRRNVAPHILTMTATPIPRTIALTMYGDLALSVLNELPKERQPITTWIVEPTKRDGAYEWIESQIEKEKIQVYVICPLIEESEAEGFEEIKSVKSEYEKLKKIFPTRKLGILHGKLKPKEKTEVLEKFKNGEFDILVATPVVEVGIDVANATIIMIETAERFGLAQLHQLRGRVGRGKKKSYCLLMTESKSPISTKRLKALKEINSGFKLAELDLKLRGPGEVFGKQQSGFAELTIANWQDVGLIQASREAAKELAGKIKIKAIKEVVPN
jgi:ATP-dependent DNA helicase RecG